MSTTELMTRVVALARAQHGLVRLTQFPEPDRRRVRHLAARGMLERVATGVYRVSGAPATWVQSLQVGVWALGKESMVSHASAARLHGLDRFEHEHSLEFTVPRSHRNRGLAGSPARVHSTTERETGDVVRVHGLPVTSPVRTIVDLARAGVTTGMLEAAVDSAARLRLTTIDRIIDRIEAYHGPARRGLAGLDRVVLTSGGHSVLERRFLQLVRRCGLPMPTPQVVHRHDGRHVARVDFLFPEQNVVVEVSGGRGHSTASDRAKDARRRNELQQMGRTVLEFTFEDVMEREAYVVRTLRSSGVSGS